MAGDVRQILEIGLRRFSDALAVLGVLGVFILGVTIGRISSCNKPTVIVQRDSLDMAAYRSMMEEKYGVLLEENGLLKAENASLSTRFKKLTGQLEIGKPRGVITESQARVPVTNVETTRITKDNDTVVVRLQGVNLDLPLWGVLTDSELVFMTFNPLWETVEDRPIRKTYIFPRRGDRFSFAVTPSAQRYSFSGIVVSWYRPWFVWNGVWTHVEAMVPHGYRVVAEGRALVYGLEVAAGLSSDPGLFARIGYRW
jgi:hypothetical protein